MSITTQDVHHLIARNRDSSGLQPQDVSRIVRVLNTHRHPTTTAAPLDGDANGDANGDASSEAGRPPD